MLELKAPSKSVSLLNPLSCIWPPLPETIVLAPLFDCIEESPLFIIAENLSIPTFFRLLLAEV